MYDEIAYQIDVPRIDLIRCARYPSCKCMYDGSHRNCPRCSADV